MELGNTPGHSPGLLCSLPRTLRRFTHLSQPRRGSPSGCCLCLTELLQVSSTGLKGAAPFSWDGQLCLGCMYSTLTKQNRIEHHHC